MNSLNMPATAIEIPPLGQIHFFQSQKARYLRITVRHDKTITVTIPKRANLHQAKDFLLSKSSWIHKQLRKIDHYAALRPLPDLNIDLEKAQTDLFNRLDCLSRMHNLPFNRAAFRRQKTRWGSCSGRNNINLNINLVSLPQHLQDYVLLHELVHTRHKNHGRLFWAQLNNLIADARKLNKEIRTYRPILP